MTHALLRFLLVLVAVCCPESEARGAHLRSWNNKREYEEEVDMHVPPKLPMAHLVINDVCQVPAEFQGLWGVEGSDTNTMMVSSDSIQVSLPGLSVSLWCIWKEGHRMIFSKDKYQGDMDLSMCVEPELTEDHKVKLTFFNHFDLRIFQLQNPPVTSSTTCRSHGWARLILTPSIVVNETAPQHVEKPFPVDAFEHHQVLMLPDHCQVPAPLQGTFSMTAGEFLVQVELGADYIRVEEGGEEVQLWCIWNDESRMVFARDNFEGDMDLAACVQAEVTDEDHISLTFLNRRDRGAFQLSSPPTTSSTTCDTASPPGGMTVQLTRQ